jgi:hypothetical protein
VSVKGEERFVMASAHPLRDPADGTLLGALTPGVDVADIGIGCSD